MLDRRDYARTFTGLGVAGTGNLPNRALSTWQLSGCPINAIRLQAALRDRSLLVSTDPVKNKCLRIGPYNYLTPLIRVLGLRPGVLLALRESYGDQSRNSTIPAHAGRAEWNLSWVSFSINAGIPRRASFHPYNMFVYVRV